MKLPYIDLYIGDWLKDSVAGCSLSAQGLWLRLLFIMQESPERGRLLKQNAKQNGSKFPSLLEPIDEVCLSRRCGCSVDEFQLLMAELWDAGVPSIENGVIFSRRMVKDERLRKIRSDAGSRGGKKTMASVCSSKSSSKTQANADDGIDNGTAVGNETDYPEVKASAKEIKWHQDARTLVHYLNSKTGSNFRESSSSMTPIAARLAEPDVTLDGCKVMIDRKCAEWKGGNLEGYLRPSTLFGKEKFNEYYAAKDQPLPPVNGKPKHAQPDHSKGWEMPT